MDDRYLADVNSARDTALDLTSSAQRTVWEANDTLADPESTLSEQVAATQRLAALVAPLIEALDHLIGETSWDDDEEDEE